MNECVCVCVCMAAVLKLDDGTGVIECWKYINAGQELSLSLGDLVTACGVLYLLDRWEAWCMCMCTCMYVYMYVCDYDGLLSIGYKCIHILYESD